MPTPRTPAGHLRWLGGAVAVTVLVAALLVVAGLWVRIREYR